MNKTVNKTVTHVVYRSCIYTETHVQSWSLGTHARLAVKPQDSREARSVGQDEETQDPDWLIFQNIKLELSTIVLWYNNKGRE